MGNWFVNSTAVSKCKMIMELKVCNGLMDARSWNQSMRAMCKVIHGYYDSGDSSSSGQNVPTKA